MKRIIAASILIAWAGTVHAEPNSSLYEQLDALRSQNAILAETLKNKEIQNKIENLDARGETSAPVATGDFSRPSMPSGSSPAPVEPARSPQVQMVSGVGRALTALVSLPDGGSIAAQVGARIPGTGVVKSISGHEVLVVGKNGLVSLPFAREAGQATASRLQPLGGR